MAQSQDVLAEELSDKVKTAGHDEDALMQFVESALDEIVDHLESNLAYGSMDGSVEDVLSSDNVVDIDVRANPLENPRIRVWVRDCPAWANDAWRDYHYPRGINAYNGKVTTSFDVRPF